MKKLTTEGGIALLADIIQKEKRHRDYERVTNMADKMKSLITGEEMDGLMRQFTRRESDGMFKQRLEITQHITSTVCKNLIKPEYKIPRSNGVRRILRYTDDTENKKLTEFESILSKFWGTMSLDKYLGKRWIDLTNLDPNSFIVYEWGDFDNKKERAKPYPFEVSAHEAIYYEFQNNILQYLVVLNEFEKGAGGMPEKVQVGTKDISGQNAIITKRFTLYINGQSIVFDQIKKETEDSIKPNTVVQLDVDKPLPTVSDGDYVSVRGNTYLVSIFDSNLDFIPAVRVGFEYDPITRGRTCIPQIWEAVPLLMKTIKANSELDLTMALSAHPQKMQYVPECQNPKCNSGRYATGEECSWCSGSGVADVVTTAQEFIKLRMPRDKEEMIPLTEILRYVSPEVAILVFQENYIKSLTAQCKEAIYNSEIFSRQEIAETATGKNIDLQNVYDALYPMAEAFAHMWEVSVHAISKITDMNKNLIYSYIFSKDFKMKSMSELIMDLKTASDSRADGFVKAGIQDDIAQILYTDDAVALARYKAKERFNPYSGKTREEVAIIVSLIPQNDFHRTLWEMYGWIFEELEREFSKEKINFYDISYDKQWDAIKKKVDGQIAEREALQPGIKDMVEDEEDNV